MICIKSILPFFFTTYMVWRMRDFLLITVSPIAFVAEREERSNVVHRIIILFEVRIAALHQGLTATRKYVKNQRK